MREEILTKKSKLEGERNREREREWERESRE